MAAAGCILPQLGGDKKVVIATSCLICNENNSYSNFISDLLS